jgi:hypothetical protein
MSVRLIAVAVLLACALEVPAGAATLWREDFSGRAGAMPNQAIWRALPCPGFVTGSDCTASRAQLDGAGALALYVTSKRGAFLGTFDYGTGWPPTGVRASWSVPFTITARLKMPTTAGIWTVIWAMNTDRTREQGLWEVDLAEPRSALPDRGAAYHHWWGATHRLTGGSASIGGPGAWHTYRLYARADKTIYTVDGRTLFEAEPLAGRFGLLVQSLAGTAGSWQTAYGPAMPTTATLTSKIDYIEVSR